MSEFNQLLGMALRERQAANTTPDGCVLMAAWNNRQLPVCAGEAGATKKLGFGGFGLEADLVLIIKLSDIVPGYRNMADLNGKIPALKQTLVYNTKSYRIDATQLPPGLEYIGLALIDPTKGA